MELSQELFLEGLRERLSQTDIDMVKQDVEPFIIDKRELDKKCADPQKTIYICGAEQK